MVANELESLDFEVHWGARMEEGACLLGLISALLAPATE
jgi:hypothetical protein